MLRLDDAQGALSVHYGEQKLFDYVYDCGSPQVESPRPYFHPVSTLAGEPVTLLKPPDHVWHRGIAWSLPNVGTENFWGGVTYRRGIEYRQLPNNGAMRHLEFLRTSPEAFAHRLCWVTESGEEWFREVRRIDVTVVPEASAWVLGFCTAMTNVSGQEIAIGSPTTEGRENAGYGGLFWRGPESFIGGRVYTPPADGGVANEGGDEMMGVRAPWMGYTNGTATLLFVDAPDNVGHPTQWFVRTGIFACVCPAPFFSAEVPVAAGESLLLRYAIVIADGDPGATGAAELAKLGIAGLTALNCG